MGEDEKYFFKHKLFHLSLGKYPHGMYKYREQNLSPQILAKTLLFFYGTDGEKGLTEMDYWI